MMSPVSRRVSAMKAIVLTSAITTHEIQATTKALLHRGLRGSGDDRESVKLSLCPVHPRGSELDLIDPFAPPRKHHSGDVTSTLTHIAWKQWDVKMLAGRDGMVGVQLVIFQC